MKFLHLLLDTDNMCAILIINKIKQERETMKKELKIAIQQWCCLSEIDYYHIEVSYVNGRFVISARVNPNHSEAVSKLFRDMNNFSCTKTSSYKRRNCIEVLTYFKHEIELISAIQYLSN